MNWYLLIPLLVLTLFLFALAIAWYQPEARHAPFAAGQVWKNDAGFTMNILQVDRIPVCSITEIRKIRSAKTLDIKRSSPDGMVETLYYYPAADFRRLIIKNRYKLV